MTEWVKDKAIKGLYKRVRESGEVWAVKSRIKGGKPITITIGNASLFSATDARHQAKLILTQLTLGINPREQQKKKQIAEKARNLTLEGAVEQYQKNVTWKDKTRNDVIATFKRRFSDWYKMPLAHITKEMCLERFMKIKEDVQTKRKKETARKSSQELVIKPNNEIGLAEAQRAFRYLSSIYNHFLNDDAGEEKLLPKGNPCDIIKAKKLKRALKPKERFLDEVQRNALYDTLSFAMHPDYPGIIKRDSADLIWLIIHTGLRLDEARTMLWSGVNNNKEVFTVFDTKNHKNHTLPMTDATKSMFERRAVLKNGHDYVFSSPLNKNTPLSANRFFLRASKEVGFDFSAHDLRRTVATVASELGYDIDSIGMVLNHAKKGVTSGYVQQTHKRLKEILEDIQNALFNLPY